MGLECSRIWMQWSGIRGCGRRGRGGMVDFGGEQAGDGEPDGRAAGGVGVAVLEQEAAGGVQDVCERWLGGRTGAANGAHDDCLMAMAVAQGVRAEWLDA